MRKSSEPKRKKVAVSKSSRAPASASVLQLRMRVRRGREIAFGPGKADLLRAVEATGSLLAAARSLDMSYMRAWSLVQEMHRCFNEPLVELSRGGSRGGGGKLTAAGADVLALYSEMENAARTAAVNHWRQLQRRLKS